MFPSLEAYTVNMTKSPEIAVEERTTATGAKLFAVDGMHPEDAAMLQALYSRSGDSVVAHLEKVRAQGSGKFMAGHYVGYGHKSIGDCGSTTMFVEDVSLLTAKAVQDNPLYCGQETSTRYLDMSKRRVIDPIGSAQSRALVESLMDFYGSSQAHVRALVAERHPRREGENEATYQKAVAARAFDVMRGFLPAGVSTQLSWHTNLRQAGDHLQRLARHPSGEVAGVAVALESALAQCYASSGFGKSSAGVSGVAAGDGAAERAAWEASTAEAFAYPRELERPPTYLDLHASGTLSLDVAAWGRVLATRPRGCVLPHWMTDFGQLKFAFMLDFGSFRDIQRQRNGVCRMPLLTTDHGFESWYLEQLDDGLRAAATELVYGLKSQLEAVTDNQVLRQYYVPIGFRVQCQLTYALPALLYVLELRTSKTVHPTLRKKMLKMAEWFRGRFPDIALHADTDEDDWTVRRGLHTITARGAQDVQDARGGDAAAPR